MAGHLYLKDKVAAPVRDSGVVAHTVTAETVEDGLGAALVPSPPTALAGSPPALLALRHELERRLHSTGGRPSLEGTSRRQKIPLSEEDWRLLEQLAQHDALRGLHTTPGQIASALLHQALHALHA
jgi:hypothetical protein